MTPELGQKDILANYISLRGAADAMSRIDQSGLRSIHNSNTNNTEIMKLANTNHY